MKRDFIAACIGLVFGIALMFLTHPLFHADEETVRLQKIADNKLSWIESDDSPLDIRFKMNGNFQILDARSKLK